MAVCDSDEAFYSFVYFELSCGGTYLCQILTDKYAYAKDALCISIKNSLQDVVCVCKVRNMPIYLKMKSEQMEEEWIQI